MKLFDKKDVFNITNAEDAKEYISKEGYFADCLYKDLNMWKKGILDEIVKDAISFPFVKLNTQDSISITFRLFLPADKVKEVEEPKKWRAFRTFEEFVLAVGLIGCHVRYRLKADKDNEFLAIVNGFNYKAQSITINAVRYTFIELFDKFEFYKNQEWQPFGMLENES